GGTALARSFALTVADVKTNAVIHANSGRGPPGDELHGNDSSLSAASIVDSTATAKDEGTPGVEAPVAINIVDGSESAKLEDGAGLADTDSLKLLASGDYTTSTTAVSRSNAADGEASRTSTGIGVQFAVPVSDGRATAGFAVSIASGGDGQAVTLTAPVGGNAPVAVDWGD